jgi:hypothetical protein
MKADSPAICDATRLLYHHVYIVLAALSEHILRMAP